MILEILEINKYAVKERYLQHITKLLQVPLSTTDTYLDLFEKLRAQCTGKDEQKAVEDFIDFNKEQVEDASIFEIPITDQEDMYAIFNLKKYR